MSTQVKEWQWTLSAQPVQCMLLKWATWDDASNTLHSVLKGPEYI